MYKNFVMFWEINKQYINTLPESGTISIENIPDFEEAFIYSFLLDKCNNRAMVNIFIAQYYKESNSIFYLISDTKKCVPGYKVGEWPGQVKNLYLDSV